jgi:phosphatidylglycerophosphate synthase
VAAVLAQALLLGVLSATVGLGVPAAAAGLAVGGVAVGGLARGLRRAGRARPGPADLVTLTRALLVGAVTALVVQVFGSFPEPGMPGLPVLVGIAGGALLLDAVDGRVARRTGTVSPLGARFDMEVDAFLIAVLSVLATRSFGGWVLGIGLARYLLWAAERVWPWLRAPVPPRYRRKVVAAIQGVVLTVAIAGVLPHGLAGLLLVIAAVLLAESFGRDVAGLVHAHRAGRPHRRLLRPAHRRVLAPVATGIAVLIVWAALVLPGAAGSQGLLRVPVEGVVLFAVGLLLPARWRRWSAAAVGVVAGLLVLLALLDVGFEQQIGRPFNPVLDLDSIGPAIGVLGDSIGRLGADLLVVGAVLAVAVLFLVIRWAMLRVSEVSVRRRGRSAGVLGVLAAAGLVGATVGLGVPPASWASAAMVADQVRQAGATVQDQHDFPTRLQAADAAAFVPASRLLTGLRGKDVLILFVESYGQVAVQDTWFSPPIDAELRSGTADLAAAGYTARSAFLNSPTFGGISWLAHSTLQSGLWVDNQQRYDQLVASRRFTLSDAFAEAGWRTVSDIPSDEGDWSVGTSFYHYQQLYDQGNVGYRGPHFSYAAVPDQFTLHAFQRDELQPGHRPVMAEIDLVSSHTPWAPLPSTVGWDDLGDGSVYDSMPQTPTPADVWKSDRDVQDFYARSIRYSLQSVVGWLTTFRDPNLVVVMLGDHQPAAVVSGNDANHLVPVTVLADDPAVLERISGWGWQPGLLPDPSAPVLPMDAFRNRFLSAFSAATLN